jgi:excisionase family DNA binding protein
MGRRGTLRRVHEHGSVNALGDRDAAGSVGDAAAVTPYLITEDVAVRLRMSKRSVHERTRNGMIPHRRLPGTRRCLFREDELEAWLDGAALETVESPSGGRVVRPLTDATRPLD